jgi:hypothetical protein
VACYREGELCSELIVRGNSVGDGYGLELGGYGTCEGCEAKSVKGKGLEKGAFWWIYAHWPSKVKFVHFKAWIGKIRTRTGMARRKVDKKLYIDPTYKTKPVQKPRSKPQVSAVVRLVSIGI